MERVKKHGKCYELVYIGQVQNMNEVKIVLEKYLKNINSKVNTINDRVIVTKKFIGDVIINIICAYAL